MVEGDRHSSPTVAYTESFNNHVLPSTQNSFCLLEKINFSSISLNQIKGTRILPQIKNETDLDEDLIKLTRRPMFVTLPFSKETFVNTPLKSPLPNVEITPRVNIATQVRSFASNSSISNSSDLIFTRTKSRKLIIV